MDNPQIFVFQASDGKPKFALSVDKTGANLPPASDECGWMLRGTFQREAINFMPVTRAKLAECGFHVFENEIPLPDAAATPILAGGMTASRARRTLSTRR